MLFQLPKERRLKDNSCCVIKEAVPEHAEKMIIYMTQVAGETDFLSFGQKEFNKSMDEQIDIVNEHHNRDNQIFLIAWLEEEIIGMLNVWSSTKLRIRHVGEFGITVKRDYWGRGVGQFLLETMIDWAKASPVIQKINLKVIDHNLRAIQLYEKLGFVKEGLISWDIQINGVLHDTYAMGMKFNLD